MSDLLNCISEYEESARKLLGLAFDYRDKAKQVKTFGERLELREKASYYERIAKEKLREAEILRRRMR